MFFDGEQRQLNMYLTQQGKNAAKGVDEMTVYLSFETMNLGKTVGTIELKGDSLAFNLYCEKTEANEMIGKYKDQIGTMLESTRYHINGITFDAQNAKKPECIQSNEGTSELKRHGDSQIEITV